MPLYQTTQHHIPEDYNPQILSITCYQIHWDCYFLAVYVAADIKYSFLLYAFCFYYDVFCVIIIGFTISTMISTTDIIILWCFSAINFVLWSVGWFYCCYIIYCLIFGSEIMLYCLPHTDLMACFVELNFPLPKKCQNPKLYVTFLCHDVFFLWGEAVFCLSICKLEDHPLSAVYDHVFNILTVCFTWFI